MLVTAIVPLAQGLFFQRLALATGLGLAIGLERQWRQRTAGLHTSTLVAVGAALFVALPELLGSTDTMRVAAQIISGVGFLAGGVILREGFNVRGLITAATLWATAAVGALAGSGLDVQAAVGAGVIVLTNLGCVPLAALITRIPRDVGERVQTNITLHVTCSEAARSAVRQRIHAEVHTTSLVLANLASSSPSSGRVEVTAVLTKPGLDDGTAVRMQADIAKIDGVTATAWDATEEPI